MRQLTRFLLMLAIVTVTIRYVNGWKITFPASNWSGVRADGVDWVKACNPLCTRFSGDSIYWMYREGKNWVIGGSPVSYGKIAPEVILKPDGTQETRHIPYMPDLKHSQVKLGWWWPGTTGHPMNKEPK